MLWLMTGRPSRCSPEHNPIFTGAHGWTYPGRDVWEAALSGGDRFLLEKEPAWDRTHGQNCPCDDGSFATTLVLSLRERC